MPSRIYLVAETPAFSEVNYTDRKILKAFTDKEKAEIFAEDENAKRFGDDFDPSNYGHESRDVSSITDEDELMEKYMALNVDEDDHVDNLDYVLVLKGLPLVKYRQVAKLFDKVKLVDVYEVELD